MSRGNTVVHDQAEVLKIRCAVQPDGHPEFTCTKRRVTHFGEMAAFVPGLTFRSYHSRQNPQKNFAVDWDAGPTFGDASGGSGQPSANLPAALQGTEVGDLINKLAQQGAQVMVTNESLGSDPTTKQPSPDEGPAHAGASARLGELGEMRDQGLITGEEFAVKKQRILDEL